MIFGRVIPLDEIFSFYIYKVEITYAGILPENAGQVWSWFDNF
jgi:hypothetical protein